MNNSEIATIKMEINSFVKSLGDNAKENRERLDKIIAALGREVSCDRVELDSWEQEIELRFYTQNGWAKPRLRKAALSFLKLGFSLAQEQMVGDRLYRSVDHFPAEDGDPECWILLLKPPKGVMLGWETEVKDGLHALTGEKSGGRLAIARTDIDRLDAYLS
jgi:hypothetical protein